MKTTHKKIGIVSGIGPLAGSDVLSKILKNSAEQYSAVEDSDYPDLVLISHGIEGVDNTGTLNSSFEEGIVDMVSSLEDQGATIIGIACNTAYTYLDKIHMTHGTSLINLIEVVALATKKNNSGYLLLTSSAAKDQKLYQNYLDTYQVNYSETSSEQQLLVDKVIHLIMAHKLDEAGCVFDEILDSAHADGFSSIIAGCTELPVALQYCKNKHELSIVNSNDELAKALLSAYYSQ